MRRRLERGLGHAYDGNAELGVDVSAKTRSAIWVQVTVAVHDDQAALYLVGQCAEHRPDGRQFAQIELAGPVGRVGRNPGDDQRALLQHGGKRRVGRGYHCCPSTGINVMNIHSGADVLPVASGDLHRSTMDHVRGLASHPLLGRRVRREIERAASAHLGRQWTSRGFTSLDDRAAHPAGIHRGRPFSVFAKLGSGPEGRAQFLAEMRGLGLIRKRCTDVGTPVPIGSGVADVGTDSLLLAEALPERPAERRSSEDYQAIGRALAALHGVHDDQFGLPAFDSFFGPLPQDNRPVASNTWADFYAERRVLPLLRVAVDSGHLPADLAAGADGLIRRLPALCGPPPRPSLIHGDAQQNNFVSTPGRAVVIDACPYFGHPEIDLALLGYFRPVPAAVLKAYREIKTVDQGFSDRIELWRIFAYLAVIAVDGANPFGRQFVSRLAGALSRYS